jgi:hypothetical protein
MGSWNPELFEIPCPQLLRDVSRMEPARDGKHVRLDKAGFKSVQRLAIADLGGGVVAAVWPGELKPQAHYLYSDGRAAALIAAAREGGWDWMRQLPTAHARESRPGILSPRGGRTADQAEPFRHA